MSEALLIEMLKFIAAFVGGGIIQTLLAAWLNRRKTQAETQHELGDGAVSIANAAKLATELLEGRVIDLQKTNDTIIAKQKSRDREFEELRQDSARRISLISNEHSERVKSIQNEHTRQIEKLQTDLHACIASREAETRETKSLRESVGAIRAELHKHRRMVALLVMQLKDNEILPKFRFETGELKEMLGDATLDTGK